jgi:hypothetical protein
MEAVQATDAARQVLQPANRNSKHINYAIFVSFGTGDDLKKSGNQGTTGMPILWPNFCSDGLIYCTQLLVHACLLLLSW